MNYLLFGVEEAQKVERVPDDGEHDGHNHQEGLKLIGLSPVSGDLRSDHHDENQNAEDRPYAAPEPKPGALHRILCHGSSQ